MCLTCPTTEKYPRQWSPLSVWTGGATQKDWPKRLSDCQLQEAWKRTVIGHNSWGGGSPCPCTLGAARVPASQAAVPPSHSTLTGAEVPQPKKALCLCVQGLFGSVQFFATLWTMACQASLSGRRVLQARILEPTGQYWLPYPSRTLYFLLSQLPTSLSTWCCQNPCNPSSCSTSTPGPHREKPKSSRAASGANPSGGPTCRGGNKPTVETQGSVVKGEDPKPSHQLCKLQTKST